MQNNYEEYYDVQLFNDIHNYLPELLYGDLNQFPNTASVLEYIRNQIRNHYDIFTSARRNYNRNVNNVNNNLNNNRNTTNTNNIRVSLNVQEESEINEVDQLVTLLASSILSLANQPVTTIPITRMPTITRQQNFMEPIIVRPSQQQIDSGSSIVENPSSNEICTICQDLMEGSHRIRRLNHCSHLFHDNCISTWFRSNVHCPTCRHDIRN